MVRFSWSLVRFQSGAQRGPDLRLCVKSQDLRGPKLPQLIFYSSNSTDFSCVSGHHFQHMALIIFNIQSQKMARFRGSQFPERGRAVTGCNWPFDRPGRTQSLVRCSPSSAPLHWRRFGQIAVDRLRAADGGRCQNCSNMWRDHERALLDGLRAAFRFESWTNNAVVTL